MHVTRPRLEKTTFLMQEINKEADETGRRNAIKINKMKAKET
jgi:hypothetical protein